MKFTPSQFIATSHLVGRVQPPILPAPAAPDADEWAASTQLARPLPARGRQFSASRWVVLLAFLYSALFLAFWLWCCVAAGAATTDTNSAAAMLRLSTYEPKNARDPFARAAATGSADSGNKTAAVDASGFRLEGVLYDPVRPAAIINDQLVKLKTPTTMVVGGREMRVTATVITRSKVTLDVNGRLLELSLDAGREPVAK